MGILDPASDERVKDLRCTGETLSVDLMDGRTIIVPLAWYPRLLRATAKQRKNWEPCEGGYGIHWPEIDEDLSTVGLLRGIGCKKGIKASGQSKERVCASS